MSVETALPSQETAGPELALLTKALAAGLKEGDLASFYRTFRSTELPFVAKAHEDQARPLFRLCFEILHHLGAISPATALAVENHYYVTSALATAPRGAGFDVGRLRDLLSSIVDRRVLVANTNSKVHADRLGAIGTSATRDGDGFRVDGTAAYMSLATEADVLVFLTRLADEGPAIFAITPLKENPAVEIGPYLFPDAMIDSDTHSVAFHDLVLPADALLVDPGDKHAGAFIAFEMVWHQLLIPALYLGAAAGAIEEVRLFARATRGRDDRLLADVDGTVVDLGRMAIEYRSACAAVLQAGDRLASVRRFPDDLQMLERAVDDAGVAKYVATRCAEEVVSTSRRMVGPRSFTGGRLLERLSREVMFGPLGPEVNSVIERRHGGRAVADEPFVKRWW